MKRAILQLRVLSAEVDADNRVPRERSRCPAIINQIFINSIRGADSFHGSVYDGDIYYLLITSMITSIAREIECYVNINDEFI